MSEDNKKISADQFKFIQNNEKIYDEKFETKPVGYFREAIGRFAKNKINLIATTILFVIILMSVLVPVLSQKNATQNEDTLQYLPPRVPLLEELGIFDGMVIKKNQTIDFTNKVEGTDLYIPSGVNQEYVDKKSVINYEGSCTDNVVECVGGNVEIRLTNDSDFVVLETNDVLTLYNDSTVTVSVNDAMFSSSAVFEVRVKKDFNSEYEAIGEINASSAGEYIFTPHEELDYSNTIYSKLRVVLSSDNDKDYISLNEISIKSGDEIKIMSGYELSSLPVVDGAGDTVRNDGIMTFADYKIDAYAQAFGNKKVILSEKEYNELIEKDGVACSMLDTSTASNNAVTNTDNCAIKEFIEKTEPLTGPDGIAYFSYVVVVDYAKYMGYEDVPYFLLGTNLQGHDMFKLIWIGTRTSLLIGAIVATINIVVGVIYGSISGYYGGKIDIVMQRFSEVVGRIPLLALLAIFFAYFGSTPFVLVGIMIVSGWIGIANVTRMQFYRYKGREYVLAARTLGARDRRLIFRHILPNGLGTIVTASVMMIPGVIFTEALISFLGFGIGHGTTLNLGIVELSGVSVGVLLNSGRTVLQQYPYLTYGPSIVVSLLMVTFNMFGNALRDALNPATRGS